MAPGERPKSSPVSGVYLETTTTFLATFLDKIGVNFSKKPERVLDLSQGKERAKWFVGARLNVSNMLDDSPEPFVTSMDEEGYIKTFSRSETLQWAKSISSWLKRNGLSKGDRVGVYMPMTAEIVPIILGIVRAGMVVVPLFSGYGKEPIKVRMEDSQTKAIFTVDTYARKGKEIEPFRNLEDLKILKIALMKKT